MWLPTTTVTRCLFMVTTIFTCNAENSNIIPAFTIEPPYHVKFSNNSGTKVECAANAASPLTISWILADGSRVQNIPGLRHTSPHGTLIFPPFRAEEYRQDVHAVVYRCLASNSQVVIVSRDVHVEAVMSQPYEPQVYDAFPLKGNTAVLKCHLPPFIGSHVVVSAWIKDNVIKIDSGAKADSKYAISSFDELFIMDVGSNDASSTFRCQTVDQLTGENRLSSTAGRLFISEPKGNVSPRIVDGTTSVIAREGEELVLPCVSQGFPTPTISWYTKSSNGHLLSLFMGDRITRTKIALIITKVKVSDTGTYVCQAENIVGSERKEINVTVTAPLATQTLPKNLKLHVNKAAHLRCIVNGAPVTSISWTRNGNPFPTKDFPDSIQVRDSGIYQCFAKNDHQMTHDTVLVNAADTLPSITNKFSEEIIQPNEEALLQCIGEGNPLPTVEWFLDDEPVPNSGRYVIDIQTENFKKIVTTLRIRNLRVVDGGLYSCKFSNKIGIEMHSARINVVGPIGVRPIATKTAIAGGDAHLNCPYFGHPRGRIVWFKGSVEIPNNPRHFVLANGTLVITKVRRNVDNGLYTCVVHDHNGGNVRQDVEVTVMIAPKIVPFNFQEELLREGMRARLQCVVSEGDSPITLQWLKDNANIEPNLGISIRHLDEFSSILTIASITPKHNGNYTCRATNAAATTTYSAKLNVNAAPKIIPFSFRDDHLFEGVLARVSCVVYQGDLPIVINWLKDGVPIKDGEGTVIRMIDEFSSILTIDRVQQKHSGNYTCVAENSAATVKSSTPLVVNVPPKWLTEPNDTSIVIGKEIMLPCSTTGFPKPTTIWMKVEGQLKNTRIPIAAGPDMTVYSNGSLLIYSAKEHHEGFYLCQSENGIELVGKMIYLKVHMPPVFDKNVNHTSVRRGDKLILTCKARGDNSIHYTWKLHGTILHEDKQPRIRIRNQIDKNNASISELVIDKTDKKDTAVYHCSAKNTFGTDKCAFHLTVKDVPETPKELKVAELSNRTVKVVWVANGDNGSPITRYVIHYKHVTATWKQVSTNVSVDGKTTAAKVTGLRPSQKYNLRVSAVNDIGASAPSEELEVTIAEEAPSGEPRDISVIAPDSNSLKVTWKPPSKEHWNGIIRGYYVGYKLLESKDSYTFRLLEVPDDFTDILSLPLTELQQFKQYSIVVQAFNDGGKGPLSKEVIAITSETVPSNPPQEVRCSVLTSSSIHVTWQPPPMSAAHGVLQGYRLIYGPVRETIASLRSKPEMKSTSANKMTLQKLEKFTNYSVQVLAYSKKGDGVKSSPIYCRTLEDVPESPVDIKALPASEESVLLAWKPPDKPNGAILSYSIIAKDKQEKIIKNSVRGNITTFEVNGLTKSETYEFWVTAFTVVGEGQRSRVIMQSPGQEKIAAKLASFNSEILSPADRDVMLPCKAVGLPQPSKKWIRSGNPIATGPRLHVLSDGSLLIKDVHPDDSDNYTCHVENERGDDHVTYSVIIQTPPDGVTLDVSLTTTTTMEVQWQPKDTGGSPILGYKLMIKNDHTSWKIIDLDSATESYRLDGLQCGTTYQLYMVAWNKLGDGKPTNVILASTKGGVPLVPTKKELLEEGSTFITINLHAWQIDMCPIKYFVVEYKRVSAAEWKLLGDDIKPERDKLVLSDLTPATWHNLRIIAHSGAGASTGDFNFATLTREGATIKPDTIADSIPRSPLSYLTDFRFILAGSTALLLVGVAAVVVLCFCNKKTPRKKHRHRRHHDGHSKSHRRSSRHRSDSDDYVEGSFTYVHGPAKQIKDGKKHKKHSSELTPYATAHLSDLKSKGGQSSNPTKSVYPQISRPASSLADSVPSSAAELLRSQVQQIPTAPPMSESYGGAFYSHVLKGDRPGPATPIKRFKDNMPPLPPIPNTPRNLITERFVRNADTANPIDDFPPPPPPLQGCELGNSSSQVKVETNYDAPWDVKGMPLWMRIDCTSFS